LNLALALHCSGQVAESEALYNRILEANPDNLDARVNLAYILDRQKRYKEAERNARIAVERAPGNTAALNVLGNALFGLGRLEESEATYHRSLRIDPSQPQTYVSLRNVLKAQERHGEAEQAIARALEIDPEYGPAIDIIGVELMDGGRPEEAIRCFERAMRSQPDSGAVVQHMAMALSKAGELEEAVAQGLRAVELSPTPEAHYSLALDQIRTGRFIEGWRNHEHREPAALLDRRFGVPRWDGSPIGSGVLLVCAEGGLGDTVQFARYLPLVVEHAKGTVVLECLPAAVELLSDIPGIARIWPILSMDAPAPEPIDFHISLLSLPTLFGTTEETIPPAALPLHVPDKERAAWRARLAALSGLKVGLGWAGSPSYGSDPERSTHLDTFAPFAAIEGLSLVGLQVGPREDEVRTLQHGLDILHMPEELKPLTKIAALMRELDLVISVDTMTAHLAGALGVETWLLLPYVTHWIWNVHQPNDTPWYPAHRLFRQQRMNDWTPVIERVCVELRSRIACR
jgi:Tfp pilus assembly protein PilF